MKEVRAFLDGPITYAFFKAQVFKKVDEFPGLLEVASIYFSELGLVDQAMYPADPSRLAGSTSQTPGGLI